MELAWKKLKEEPYKAGFRRLIKRTFQLPNGQIEDFDLYNDGDTATAMAFTKDGQVITAKHYRPGPEKILNELIGGYIEKHETPAEAIERELLEETGYKGEVIPVGSCYFSAYAVGQKHIFIIQNCVNIGPTNRESTEYMDLELMDRDEFIKGALAGNTTDLDAILLILRYLGHPY